MNHQLLGYATYIPAYRMAPGGSGEPRRIAAAFDEDTTTMAVAAVRAIPAHVRNEPPTQLTFSTATPAYMDKTNATTIHAALGFPADIPAADAIGTARSAASALRSTALTGGVLAMADVRTGRPGSSDERNGADAAAAFWFGPGPGIARVLATASATSEFLDRWRLPTHATAQHWEERFGSDQLGALIIDTVQRGLDAAGLAAVDHVVIASPNAVTRKQASRAVRGKRTTATPPIGHGGAVDLGLAIATALESAEPDQTILVVSAVDGCDVVLMETTTHLADCRPDRSLADQLGAAIEVPYARYLGWRGLLDPEPPRRPEPARPAGPPVARGTEWKFGLTGSRCDSCGFVHLPPARVCRQCGHVDQMIPASVADLAGTVATFTVDRLAFSPSPPVVDAVIDLDGGGRCTLEMADARAEQIAIGDRVDLVFRKLYTAGDVHNYFWKARSLGPRQGQENEQ